MIKTFMFRKILAAALLVLWCPWAYAGASILVIANNAGTPSAMRVDSPEVKAAVQRVASHFADKGLYVIEQSAVKQMYEDIVRAGNFDFNLLENDLIKLACSKQASLLVKVELFALPVDKSDTATVRAVSMMYDVSTGRRLAMSEQYGTNVIRGENQTAAARMAAASKAGARVARRMYGKLEKNHAGMLARMTAPRKPCYHVVIAGYGERENDAILIVLEEDMGLDPHELHEKQATSGLVELEVFTTSSLGRFSRAFKRRIAEQGIEIEEKIRDESRVVFIKPGSDSLFGQIDRE